METPTPLEPAPAALAAFTGRDELWLKREDVHELGAFKWRAAAAVVDDLARRGHETVVTASTGNHGAAVAWACRRAGLRALVYVPPGASERKLALLERFGAEVVVAGRDLDEAKDAARAAAAAPGLPFFEDGAEPLQYEAYAAIGDEIADQAAEPPATVVVPVGNGALAIGVGEALARRLPHTRRVGAVAAEMPVMAASWEAGRAVDAPARTTIADGLAVRVAIPLAVERLRTALDAVVRVPEADIAAAMVAAHEAGVPAEPSAAAGLAAVRAIPGDGPVVALVTGRNVDPALVASYR